MSARAVWKGQLALGSLSLPVKLYSAVEDRAIHFHLLDAKDHQPVEQRVVRKDNGETVPRERQRKAMPLDAERAVILQPDELEGLEPESDRRIRLLRFVPKGLLDEPWFDRPYWLGPDGDDEGCTALADALGRRRRTGIARWVMREKRYLGALDAVDGRLMMTTLRRRDQVLDVPAIRPDAARTPSDAELKLAQQLIETISGDFEPARWKNDHRERIQQLIEAKARGRTLHVAPPRPRPAVDDLAEGLRASLAAARENKRA